MSLVISRAALPYILYQQTDADADTLLGPGLMRLGTRLRALRHPIVTLRARLNAVQIRERFTRTISNDFRTIEPYLPALAAPSIVDIGCGVGGIDALLSNRYAHRATFALVDRTRVEPDIWYGFKDEGSFYNDLAVTKRLLIDNGVPAAHLALLTPEQYQARSPRADLILSLESWGYHYPVSVYLDVVRRSLAPGGTLILDVRVGSGGRALLAGAFASLEVVATGNKCERIACRFPHENRALAG